MNVINTFLFKWVLHAFESRDFNLQELLRFKIKRFQLHMYIVSGLSTLNVVYK
jgi:hypothetical protein